MLEVRDLKIEFYDHSRPEIAVRDVDFTMEEGEIIGLVGESGSGKSLTATAIAGLIRRGDVKISGEVLWNKKPVEQDNNKENALTEENTEETTGNRLTENNTTENNTTENNTTENNTTENEKNENRIDLLRSSRRVMRSLQGAEIGFIFQDPMTAFSPVHKIGYQVEDALRVHGKKDAGESYTKEELKEKALKALASVELPDPERVYNSYPFELSGGMRQRAMIASAMISKPRLLIADEPTTALDVTVQAEIIKLLKKINEKNHTAILFISHDLGLVRKLCSKVIVLKDGDVVESGSAEEIFSNPTAEYTKKLIAANIVLEKDSTFKVTSNGNNPKISNSEENSYREHSNKEHKIHTVNDNNVENLTVDNEILNEEISNNTLSESKDSENNAEIECEVRNFNYYYPIKKKDPAAERIGIRDINVTIHKGEIVGLVGESGSGKSTLAKCIVGLLSSKEGEIKKGKVGMVFQDSYSALNPKMRVFSLLREAIRLNGLKEKEEQKARINKILEEVELPRELLERYPAELSGGQRQRVMIAMALLQQPTLLVADEPVSALDVAIQESILKLLKKLSDEHNMAILFISHDLRTVYTLCDKVLVMQKGVIVEEAGKEELFVNPKEEYTKLLLRSALE